MGVLPTWAVWDIDNQRIARLVCKTFTNPISQEIGFFYWI